MNKVVKLSRLFAGTGVKGMSTETQPKSTLTLEISEDKSTWSTNYTVSSGISPIKQVSDPQQYIWSVLAGDPAVSDSLYLVVDENVKYYKISVVCPGCQWNGETTGIFTGSFENAN